MSKPHNLPLASPQLLAVASVVDERGTLCFLEAGTQGLPFVPQRTFWITDVPSDAQRGGHAHTTCHEFIVAVQGEFSVVCYDGKERTSYCLARGQQGLWVPAGVWCELHSFSADAICLVVASEPYDHAGYINDCEAFEAYVNRGHTLSE